MTNRHTTLSVFIATTLALGATAGCGGGEGEPSGDAGPEAPDVAPAPPDAARDQPDAAPVAPDAARAQPDAAPVAPDAARAQPDAATAQPDAAPVAPDAARAQPDAAPVAPDAAPDAAPMPPTPRYVRIEPGVFTMGSPADELGRNDDETQHQVTLTRAFELKATEVTQAEWRAVMGNNPSYFAECGDDCPVELVSWYDAIDYCDALSAQQGLAPCYDADRNFVGLDCEGYRLPTEAEWEYAARAGTQTAFHTGGITNPLCGPLDPNLDAAGWYCGNSGVGDQGCYDVSDSGGPVCAGTHQVGQKQPNAWGLYDMHGNVWEWVNDRYGEYSPGAAVDPVGPASGDGRVYRGGGWLNDAQRARAAPRSGGTSDHRGIGVGFRPLRAL